MRNIVNPARASLSRAIAKSLAAGGDVYTNQPANPAAASKMLDDEIARTEPLCGKASADDVRRMADAIAFRLNLTVTVDDEGSVNFQEK